MCGCLVALGLSGCSSLKLEDVAGPATAATVAAGTAVLTVNPIVGIAAGTAAGAAVEVAIPEPESVDIAQVENEHQAQVAEKQITANTIMDFIHWIIGGVVVLTIVAWVLPGPQFMFRRKKDVSETRRRPVQHRPRVPR